MKEILPIIHQKDYLLSFQLLLVKDKNIYFKTPSRRLDSWEYKLIAPLLVIKMSRSSIERKILGTVVR